MLDEGARQRWHSLRKLDAITLHWLVQDGVPVQDAGKKKTPINGRLSGLHIKAGGVLLSHGNSHTIIGAERFHFRVRNGIGWFPFAMAASQTFSLLKWNAVLRAFSREYNQEYIERQGMRFMSVVDTQHLKPLGCYMVKPHGQLVLVSFTHYCASTPNLST